MMEDRVSTNQGAGKGYGVEECQCYGYEYIFGLHHISLEDNIPDPQSHLFRGKLVITRLNYPYRYYHRLYWLLISALKDYLEHYDYNAAVYVSVKFHTWMIKILRPVLMEDLDHTDQGCRLDCDLPGMN